MVKSTSALKVIDKLVGDDREMRKLIAEQAINAHVAQMIFDARSRAGLTQKDLAKLIGTTQSVIARLEDADYEGHSLSMLSRIASALNKQVEIRFVGKKRSVQRARR